MPQWLILFLAEIAIKYGLAALMAKFPWIPKEVKLILDEFLNKLKDPESSNSASKKSAIAKIRQCTVGCSAETK